MALSSELEIKFDEAKTGSDDAVNYLIAYFMQNVERQIGNLNFNVEEKSQKTNLCRHTILRNIHTYYDLNSFIQNTLNDLKNIIYLNETKDELGSRSIIDNQSLFIRSQISMMDLDEMNMPVTDKELARLYYEGKEAKELASIFKCSETLIYARLRRIADKMVQNKVSTYNQNDNSLLYKK